MIDARRQSLSKVILHIVFSTTNREPWRHSNVRRDVEEIVVIGFCVKTSESLTLRKILCIQLLIRQLRLNNAKSSVGNPYVFAATGRVGLGR